MSENSSSFGRFVDNVNYDPYAVVPGIVAGVGAAVGMLEYSSHNWFLQSDFTHDKQLTDEVAARGDTLNHPAPVKDQEQLQALQSLPTDHVQNLEVVGVSVGAMVGASLVVALGAHGISRLVRRSLRSIPA